MKNITKENYPSWLVPIEIARKLTKIGISNSEILVCNDDSYGWYRNGEIYDYDNDGDFIEYTTLEVSKWKNSILEPTYTWEQVFEWFRNKKFYSIIDYCGDKHYSFRILKMGTLSFETNNKIYSTYKETREALVEKLIEVYKQNKNENNI